MGLWRLPRVGFSIILLPSIRKTYKLLENYEFEKLAVYEFDRLGLWVKADP